MHDFSARDYLRMPAEWEKQDSTWIAWPHNKDDWPGKFEYIPEVFSNIIYHILKVQKVNLLIQNSREKDVVLQILKKKKINIKNLHFISCKTDRAWLRDSFPIFVKNKNGKKKLINWKFNAWAKYNNFSKDRNIHLKIKNFKKYKVITPRLKNKHIVLEGGSIDVNGKDTVLTTRECLLSTVQQRNPGLKKTDYENIFRKFLGIKNVVWLNKGIKGDDTHGHIDDIARFISKNKIFVAFEKNKKDKNHKILCENIKVLEKFSKKNKIKIIQVPMPKPKFIQNIRLPASYLNFYIANKIVLLPTFNDPNDNSVIKLFKKHFKNRKVIPVDCSVLVWGFGTIHCLTQQEPV